MAPESNDHKLTNVLRPPTHSRSQSAHHRRDGPAAARQILRGGLDDAIIVHRAPRGDEIVGGAVEPRRPGAQLRHESRWRQVGFCVFGPGAAFDR